MKCKPGLWDLKQSKGSMLTVYLSHAAMLLSVLAIASCGNKTNVKILNSSNNNYDSIVVSAVGSTIQLTYKDVRKGILTSDQEWKETSYLRVKIVTYNPSTVDNSNGVVLEKGKMNTIEVADGQVSSEIIYANTAASPAFR